jgi:hypothetical protein
MLADEALRAAARCDKVLVAAGESCGSHRTTSRMEADKLNVSGVITFLLRVLLKHEAAVEQVRVQAGRRHCYSLRSIQISSRNHVAHPVQWVKRLEREAIEPHKFAVEINMWRCISILLCVFVACDELNGSLTRPVY